MHIRRLCNESTGDSPEAVDRVMGKMFKDGRILLGMAILTPCAAGRGGKDVMVYEETKLYWQDDEGVGCRAIISSDGNVGQILMRLT